MLIPTIIIAIVAIALLLFGYYRGQGQHAEGLKAAFDMGIEILPLLIFAFIIAGMIQALIPKETVSRWIGADSGMRGILIGTIVGGFTPGGPYVSMPILAGLMRSGASIGTAIAFITAWSLWGFSRLPIEIGILGWRFAFIRLACTFFFPPIAGFIAQCLFTK